MELKSGQKLWEKAKTIIPSGNQLLSKRSERFLPENWPSYYKSASGCIVKDLDGNDYYDFAQMGVGSCILGYANEEVNSVVIDAVKAGSMSSLNSYEEVQLAEKLIELHPWSEMARFARTGGEACAVGIRIARAATGKDKVAFCGYHGWHDWYISSNIGASQNLDEQLLPGLKPKGVPRQLKQSSLPFLYNDIASLEKIISANNDIGVIIMEPQRNENPKDNFLQKVKNIAKKIGAVLIFDEVTSGFRMNNGGIHLTYNEEPDIAIFGKALGNGFPIAAIIGRREVMEAAQSSFISSTFWTERIGFTAALKTLEIIERDKVYLNLLKYGNQINDVWVTAAKKSGLDIHISGIPQLTHISFKNKMPMESQTFYTQEMLKRGFLLGASIYSTNAYNKEIIANFGSHTTEVFTSLSRYLNLGIISEKLEGPVIETGFKRLN
jgi:glutamate-1-semialdehyde 2,1-aminomutase